MIYDIKKENDSNISFAKLGNKAKELIVLKNKGYNVPEGFVLDIDTFDEIISFNGLEEHIVTILDDLKYVKNGEKESVDILEISDNLYKLFDNIALVEDIVCKINTNIKDDKKYAVRSSSVKEDLDNYSFAGMYDTYLNVEGRRGIKEAIIKCYRSLFSVNVLTYLRDHNFDFKSLKMAVIVQEMVPSEYSGVVFGVNPISGQDTQMVIEAVEGLGNNYVDGTTKPETYYYDWYKEQYSYSEDNKFLDRNILDKIASNVVNIQKLYGRPCDVEYGIVGGEVYILQVRSITKIEHGNLDRVWTTANYRDGGVSSKVCHAFMYSLYEYVWDNIMGKYLIESKLRTKSQLPDKLIGMYYGRPYWDLTTVKLGISATPGYKEREFDSEYSIEMDYEGDGETTGYNLKSLKNGIKILLAQRKIVRELNNTIKDHMKECMDVYNQYESDMDKEYTYEQLKEKWLKLIKEYYLKSEAKYFWHIYVNTVEQSINKNYFLKYVDEMEYLDLLGGMNDISHMRSFSELFAISRLVIENQVVRDFFNEKSNEEIAKAYTEGKFPENIEEAMDEYIRKYGYHSNQELDITYPCFREKIDDVIGIIKQYMELDEEQSPLSEKHDRYSVYRAKLQDVKKQTRKSKFRKFLFKLKNIRTMLWNREELKDISTRYYYLIRVYTLKLAEELHNKGLLKDVSDIWSMELKDIYNLLDGKIGQKDVEIIVNRNRTYYKTYENYENENEIGQYGQKVRRVRKRQENGLKGVGCNSGIVTATARVIHDVSELDGIKRGDILIAKYTDTGWTPKFAKLGGIVTEYGGILCHAAIVSREYGIPCIVCAHKAMKKIKDGDIITIDGKSGNIIIKED